jgi:hypothetical protein
MITKEVKKKEIPVKKFVLKIAGKWVLTNYVTVESGLEQSSIRFSNWLTLCSRCDVIYEQPLGNSMLQSF